MVRALAVHPDLNTFTLQLSTAISFSHIPQHSGEAFPIGPCSVPSYDLKCICLRKIGFFISDPPFQSYESSLPFPIESVLYGPLRDGDNLICSPCGP